MTDNLRILYSSNAFWAKSGYGVQGLSLLPRLAELSEIGGRDNIAQFAWYGSQGGMHNVEGFQVYPAGTDAYGGDIIGSHTRHFEADIVITLIDAWVCKGTGEKVKPALWLPWLPVDHYPVPPKVIDAIQDAFLPLSYSKWGHALLKSQGVENRYLPHGLETSAYKILEADKVEGFKQNYLKHQGHITIMVAANKGYPDRKALGAQIMAWAEFAKDKPDCILYVHTEPTPLYGGLNLPALTKLLGVGDRVFFPDRYENFLGMSSEYLSYIYNSANIMMACSRSEGFGIPIIESQACGTPVITSNFSSMPELIQYGTILEPSHLNFTQFDVFDSYPDQKAITLTLEENYQEWIDRGKTKDLEASQKAMEKIHAEYDWDLLVQKHWQPLMTELYNQVKKPSIAVDYVEPKKGKIVPCN